LGCFEFIDVLRLIPSHVVARVAMLYYSLEWKVLVLRRTKLIYEPRVGSGEQGKRERGVVIVIRNPKIKDFD
jgi:hypothetical protein